MWRCAHIVCGKSADKKYVLHEIKILWLRFQLCIVPDEQRTEQTETTMITFMRTGKPKQFQVEL